MPLKPASSLREPTSVAYDGFLYVLGGIGAGSRPFGDVQRAPILANGTLGPFSATTALPRARRGHSTIARDGFLYVVGGTDGSFLMRDVQVAPILSWPKRRTLLASWPFSRT